MNWNFIAFVILVFLTVLTFIASMLKFWSHYWGEDTTRIKQRLNLLTGKVTVDRPLLVKTRLLSRWPLAQKLLKQVPHIDDLDVFLSQAGLPWNVSQFLATCLLLWFGTFLATLLVLGMGVAWLLGAVPVVLVVLFLQHKRQSRVLQIEVQLPDTLDLMARAMQAGHAFSSALLIVGTEGMQPIRGEFQTTFDEINFGIPTETALYRLTQRIASKDLRFFVVAVMIQLETGGNLTEILKSLASLIRDRQRIAGTVRVLTAEGRLSAWILGLLPFVIASILSVINFEFISKLWTQPMGVRMLQVSLTLMAMGVWWMSRMVRIRI